MNHAFSDAVECVIDDRRVLLPASAVERVIELDVAPCPLARPSVAGVGTLDGMVVISIRLGESPRTEAKARRITGALVGSRGDKSGKSKARWAIEVTRIVSLVKAKTDGRRADETWLVEAETQDARRLPMVDLDTMLGDLGVRG